MGWALGMGTSLAESTCIQLQLTCACYAAAVRANLKKGAEPALQAAITDLAEPSAALGKITRRPSDPAQQDQTCVKTPKKHGIAAPTHDREPMPSAKRLCYGIDNNFTKAGDVKSAHPKTQTPGIPSTPPVAEKFRPAMPKAKPAGPGKIKKLLRTAAFSHNSRKPTAPRLQPIDIFASEPVKSHQPSGSVMAKERARQPHLGAGIQTGPQGKSSGHSAATIAEPQTRLHHRAPCPAVLCPLHVPANDQ